MLRIWCQGSKEPEVQAEPLEAPLPATSNLYRHANMCFPRVGKRNEFIFSGIG